MSIIKPLSALSLFVIIDLFLVGNCSVPEGKLVFAHVIFRHGDRPPIETYPNDPWKDQKYWPVGFGELTNTGKEQHYNLGKWLRKRYDSLVSEKFNISEIRVQSTDVDRVIMSAQANFAGFFPPKGNDVWNKDLLWQPVPVHSIPEEHDDFLHVTKKCPAYRREMHKLFQSDEFKSISQQNKPLYDYLSLHTGNEIKRILDVEYLSNCLEIEEANNLTLPDWTRGVYPEKTFPVVGLSFASRTYTPLLARLKTGPLLKEILGHFMNKTLGLMEQNYWVYSAHDSTIANMLNTLGLFKPMGYHPPPFASAVLFELRQHSKHFEVQIFYKNTTAEPKPLHIPECGTSCPLGKTFDIYKNLLPFNWDEECQVSIFTNDDDSISYFAVTAILVSFMIIIGLLAITITKACKRREYKW